MLARVAVLALLAAAADGAGERCRALRTGSARGSFRRGAGAPATGCGEAR